MSMTHGDGRKERECGAMEVVDSHIAKEREKIEMEISPCVCRRSELMNENFVKMFFVFLGRRKINASRVM